MKSKCKSQAESAHDRFVLRTESYPFLSFLTVERVAESSSLIRELDLADNGITCQMSTVSITGLIASLTENTTENRGFMKIGRPGSTIHENTIKKRPKTRGNLRI